MEALELKILELEDRINNALSQLVGKHEEIVSLGATIYPYDEETRNRYKEDKEKKGK